MATIKFFKKATEPITIETGNFWFDTTTQSIKVKTDTGYDVFGIGLKDAQLLNNKLTITRSDNTTVVVDFNDIASASSVAAALNKKVDKTITITGTDGLSGGGNLAESRTISHAVPAGAAAKTSGLYKIATDKFGHVTSTAAVTKTDITALGIPATDTNTTYTFQGASNGFKVTPSNGETQTVIVSPSIKNNVTKTDATTTAGYIPKFNNTTGVIENGYSVQTTLASSSTAIPTAAAVVAAIDNKIAVADAMIYKGTLGTDGTVTKVPANGYKVGWTYKVITAGTYAGIKCEVGDMLIAINNGPVSGTTVVNADWTVVQANIDGAVTGPASATAGHIAVFDGATGKVIKDGTYTIATSVPSNAVFTDTKVTSADNHYKPANGTTLIGTAGSPVTAGGKVITGITADSSGHITDIITGTIPAAPTLSGLGGVGTINASGTAPLTLSASKSSTTVTISGSVAEMTAATSKTAGAAGIVPAPDAGKQAAFLRGDGTWAVPANTNTTYTFASGTAGNFTVTPGNFGVTPSGGTTQTVSVGKPATAGTADKVGHALTLTVAGGSTEGTSKYTFDGSAGKALNIVAGSNVKLTPAAGQLTIAATDTKYTHPAGSAASKTSGFYKFSTDSTSHIASVTTVAKADITSLIGSNTYDAYGAASTAETNAKKYADSLLAWSEFE